MKTICDNNCAFWVSALSFNFIRTCQQKIVHKSYFLKKKVGFMKSGSHPAPLLFIFFCVCFSSCLLILIFGFCFVYCQGGSMLWKEADLLFVEIVPTAPQASGPGAVTKNWHQPDQPRLIFAKNHNNSESKHILYGQHSSPVSIAVRAPDLNGP